jgi:hypothetical protein
MNLMMIAMTSSKPNNAPNPLPEFELDRRLEAIMLGNNTRPVRQEATNQLDLGARQNCRKWLLISMLAGQVVAGQRPQPCPPGHPGPAPRTRGLGHRLTPRRFAAGTITAKLTAVANPSAQVGRAMVKRLALYAVLGALIPMALVGSRFAFSRCISPARVTRTWAGS